MQTNFVLLIKRLQESETSSTIKMQVTSFNDNEAYESDKEEQKGNDLKVNCCIYIYIYCSKNNV